jgi:hypothetical protein
VHTASVVLQNIPEGGEVCETIAVKAEPVSDLEDVRVEKYPQESTVPGITTKPEVSCIHVRRISQYKHPSFY